MKPRDDARRLHPRRALGGIELLCYRSSASAAPQARRNIGREILDISPGGARLRLAEEARKGDPVIVEIKDRETGESFRARGEVRWCASEADGFLAGLHFSEIYTPIGRRERFTGGPAPAAEAGAAADRMEKRSSPRFVVEDYVVTCLKIGPLSDTGLRRNFARGVENVGLRGVQIDVGEPLDPGDPVSFSLHLNRFADTLECRGEVRWCRPAKSGGYRAGIQFVDLTEEKRRKLDLLRREFGAHA